MSILRLPEETVCKIFSLSVQGRYPSFMLPGPFLLSRSSHIDCISPDDINIASVCRLWREIALSAPSLRSTLFISPRQYTETTLRQAIKVLDRCLERSGNMPFSCFFSFVSSGYDDSSNLHRDLERRLFCTLLEHQKAMEGYQHTPFIPFWSTNPTSQISCFALKT